MGISTLRAYLVYADADYGEHVPIGGNLQRYLEVAIDIDTTSLLAYGVYTGLDIQPIGNAVGAIYTHAKCLCTCIERCSCAEAEIAFILGFGFVGGHIKHE